MAKDTRSVRKSRRIILVLTVLLVLCAAALALRVQYMYTHTDHSATAVVQDNQIGSQPGETAGSGSGALEVQNARYTAASQTTTIALHWLNSRDNLPFQVSNMLPGDSVTQHFNVRVSHSKPVQLCFTARLDSQTCELADVLNIRVTLPDTDTVLYDGPFARVDSAGYCVPLAAGDGSTLVRYQVDVSLPGSAGNEYQSARLVADLQWSVQEEGGSAPNRPESGGSVDVSGASPDTGDGSTAALWAVCMLAALLAMPAVWLYGRREGEHYAE